MNKNEALARCRNIWVTLIKGDCEKLKYQVVEDLYSHLKSKSPNNIGYPFKACCPLCEYLYDFRYRGSNCNKCLNWVDGRVIGNKCMGYGSSYRNYDCICEFDDAKALVYAKQVLALIDKAIACYDRTGDWK